MWIGVNRKSRGQGVAQACFKGVSDFAKAEGFKRMTLEVPGISPDARHIYEKFGFKEVGKTDGADDFWGGLTIMERRF